MLDLCAEGMTCEEIGAALGISSWTVKTHRAHLFRKLSAKNTAHAVAKGYNLGLLGEL